MTQPTEPAKPTTVERDDLVRASIRRRERLLDEIDRLQAELRRTRADLRRARSWFGIRAARALRGRLGTALGDVTRNDSVGRSATGRLAGKDSTSATWDAASRFRADLTGRLTGLVTEGRRPVRVAIIGRSTEAPAAADDGMDPEPIQAAFAALGLDALVLDTAVGRERLDGSTDVALLLDPSVDISAMPDHLIRIGWVGNAPDRWLAWPRFDDLDVVLVADDAVRTRVEAATAKAASAVPDLATAPGAEAFRATLERWLAARHVAIHLAAPTWEAAAGWGDTPFARGVQRAFERRGWPATVHVFAERDRPAAIRADLSLHLFGLRAPAVRPGQPTILWIISHPDLVRRELCLAYDLIGVASDPFLGYLREWLGPDCPPLLPLHQATDPDRFYPEAGAPPHHLLFVGSARDGRRPIIDDLAGTPHDLAVYGRRWAGSSLDPSHLRGDWIANDRLHQYYASAAIVLSDTWADMRDEGFVANRVYDVLASGGFVISDDVVGIENEFDGAVPVYEDRDELWRLIETYLADPAGRATLAERGRRIVIERHTFDVRIDAMLAAIGRLRGSRGT